MPPLPFAAHKRVPQNYAISHGYRIWRLANARAGIDAPRVPEADTFAASIAPEIRLAQAGGAMTLREIFRHVR